MLPLESTTRQVGAGVSGTLKSAETRRMLLPFSVVCVTKPVLALGPSNLAEVWDVPAANATLAAVRTAASEKTDSKRLSCISVLLRHFQYELFLHELDGMAVRVANHNGLLERRRIS